MVQVAPPTPVGSQWPRSTQVAKVARGATFADCVGERWLRCWSEPIGAWLAGDIPHAHPLPNGRIMWLLNDSFIATDSTGDIAASRFVRNTAISQDRSTFALLESSGSFQSAGETTLDRWWWFHGGVVNGANLLVVTTEMVRIAPISWSINFEPRSTWITTIEPRTRSWT